MKKFFGVLCLFTLACQAPVEQVASEESVEQDSAQPSFIRLSPEAIQRAGLLTEKVQRIETPNVLTLPGQVTFNEDRTFTAGSFVEGIVIDCCKAVGASVRRGEILAELHSHQTHELLGEYRQVRAALDARRAEKLYAEAAEQRARRLLELKAGSERELQQAETNLAVAVTSVASAEAGLESALAHFEYLGIETGELRRGEAPDHLKILVKAPADGVIVERMVSQGDVVAPSTALFRMSNLNDVWVIARASEQQLEGLTPGMAARFRVRAFADKSFSGRVLRISDELDLDTKAIQVVVAVSNPGRSLKTGMYGDVELLSSVKSEMIAVPEQAVQLIDAQETVFVMSSEGTFLPRSVTIGRSVDGKEEILDGLDVDETIVTEGAFALKSELLKSRFAEEE